MANKQEKWQEIANRGLQDKFDPQTRAKFDEAVNRGLITIPEQAQQPQQQVEQPQASPIGAITGRDYSKPQPGFNAKYRMEQLQSLPPLEDEGETGLLGKFGSLFSGKNKETAITKALKDQYKDMGFFETQEFMNDFMGDKKKAARYEAETMTVFDAMEQAKIAANINPELEIKTEQDAQGNDYPILINSRTGQASLVNNMGVDGRDVTKAIGTGLLFLRGKGLKGGAAKKIGTEVARSAAIQTGIEAQHAASGGDFDPVDIAATGVGGGIGEAIPIAAKTALSKVKGWLSSADDVAKAATEGAPTPKSSLTEKQQIRVDSLKKGFEAKKGELTGPQKMTQMKQALAEGDEAKVAAMIDVDEDYLKALKQLGIKEQGLPSTSTKNTQLQQIEQGLKKVPGSENSQIESKQIIELSQKADDLIEEFGGNLDKAEVSKKLLGKVTSNIDELGKKSEDIYKLIGDKIDNTAISEMESVGTHLTNELADLGGDITQLSSLEKRLLAMSKSETTTYKALDKLRKEVGAKIGGSSTKFADEDTATLKKLYTLLTEDQEAVAKHFEMGETWDIAKGLVKQRKELEENAIKLFGKELNENVMSKLSTAVTALGDKKANYKAFFDTISSIPKRDRQEVIISSLNDVFTAGSRKEKQLAIPGFADWYNGLSRSPQIKKALFSYLPPQLSKQLDAMGKVTNSVRNAMGQAPIGGQVMATPGVLNNLMDGISKKLLVGIVSKIPGLGIVGDITEAGLKQGKEKGAEKAIEVLSSPEFISSVKATAQGQVKKATALEAKLLSKNHTKAWLKSLTKQEQNLIMKNGLINWISSEDEEE